MEKRLFVTAAEGPLCLLLALGAITCVDGRYGSFICTDRRNGAIRSEGVFYDYSFATFASPKDIDHFNGFYFDNMTCQYTFRVPPGMHVYVEFALLQLARDDCEGDFVTLQLPGNERRKICGEPHGSVYDIYEGNQGRITFKSDDESRNLGFSGFFIAYDPDLNVLPTVTSVAERRFAVVGEEQRVTSSSLPKVEAEERDRDVENEARSNAWLLHNTQVDEKDGLSRGRDERRSAEPTEAKQTPKSRERARLRKAAAVKNSFRRKTLQFMRASALHGGDLTHFCGASYAKTRTDLTKLCCQNNGLL